MTNIDCGSAGYKTPKEIELEKKVHILNEANMKLENELWHFADLSKKVEHLQEQLKIAESTLVICALNRIYSSINAKEYLDKYVKGWESGV